MKKPIEKIIHRKMYAGFDGGRQVTAWDARSNKVHSIMRNCFGLRRNDAHRCASKERIKGLSLRSRYFIEKRQFTLNA